MADPFYDYFGTNPVTIILKTTDNFNGGPFAPANVIGDIKPGVVTFPAQAGGGLLKKHTRPLLIQNILSSAYPLTVSIVFEDLSEAVIAELTVTNKSMSECFVLPVNASLKLVGSGGAGQVMITAQEHSQLGSIL
jgi:hypothetical protein